MATQVKDTPVLNLKEAKRFNKAIAENKNRKVPAKDYQRAKHNFRCIKLKTS